MARHTTGWGYLSQVNTPLFCKDDVQLFWLMLSFDLLSEPDDARSRGSRADIASQAKCSIILAKLHEHQIGYIRVQYSNKIVQHRIPVFVIYPHIRQRHKSVVNVAPTVPFRG